MPLRDLPTESTAAAALLRTEEVRLRRTLRRTPWHGAALACLAVGAALSVLVPGPAGTDCYLWRATTQPVDGRGAALALPVAMIVLLLADRLTADNFRHRQQVRGWGAVGLAVITATAWIGLAGQGRAGCSTSPTVIGIVACGTLAAAVAAYWAIRTQVRDPVLAEAAEDASDEPLNQSELRAIFLRLTSLADVPARSALVPIVAGTLAALLLLSTALPWRELIDPVSIGPAGAEAGLARAQLWDLPYASSWALAIAGTAVATLAAAIVTLVRAKPTLLVLRTAAVATGSLAVTGVLTALLRLPARLPDGVGYRPGLGAWLALALGVLLLAVGLTTTVLSVRRRSRGWALRLGAVVLAGLVAVGAGVVAPAAAAPQYRPQVVVGVPHQLLDLHGGQLVDRLGMRVAIGTSDPLDSIAGTLDGKPGEWLLGRTGSEGSTVFEYRDGFALPRVSLSHGVTPPALLGVTDNKLVILAGGAADKHWAILAIPLNLVAADVSLSHTNPDGTLYVTPGIDTYATGRGPALTHRNADRSIVIWGSTSCWQIPANQLRTGMDLKQFLVAPGPGAPGNSVSTGPDGTTAWRTGQTGLALLRPGGKPQQVTGVAPAGCLPSSDAASSSLTVEAFAVDVRGNLWLGGSSPTAVLTPDGLLRQLPGAVSQVDSMEARPDGSVLLGVSPGGGDQVLEITDAAASASSYPVLGEPEPRCDRRKVASGSTPYRATLMPAVPVVAPPVTAEGVVGKATSGTSTQLALDSRGRLVRLAVPNAAHVWAPDGQGGVWWTVSGQGEPTTEVAVHLTAGRATVLRDPKEAAPNQRGEFAAAAGDRLVTAIGTNLYNFYGPGRQVSRVKVSGTLRQNGLVQLSSGEVAMVIDEQLLLTNGSGKTTKLFGGDATGWPVASATTPDKWTTDGNWFTGPDGKIWGYDGSKLTRVDGPGRVTVVAGPAQGVPQAADEVTVINNHLYFELGNDIVNLEPLR
ncbi:hypothetical protein F1D05_16915 [Kribbella qitaiheensis]|uniref:Uncharacterized protein n=1 Tax=Kribbella qitaiheensis TaxID=1544730 RepID=A0A7G6WZ73_9ACTN|nr:hypothetical protein [Kribbella qitaiheensis]QNE19288.1 hypothetical protein F1D05_16915 [Kribbella qitaiheensis]